MPPNANSLISVADYKVFGSIEDSHLYRNGITIYSTDGTLATVAKYGGNLLLVKTGGTNPTKTISLAAAGTDTLGGLVATINAYAGGGWQANLEGWAAASSLDLVDIRPAIACTGFDGQVTLQFVDNFLIESIINYCSRWIEVFLRRTIKSTTYTRERYSGGGDEIILRNYPVTAIGQVSCGQLYVLRISFPNANVYNARVVVTSTGIKLDVDGQSWAEVTFAANTTMTAIAAAINALAIGADGVKWEAAVLATMFENYPSNLLIEEQAKWARQYPCMLAVPSWPLDGAYLFDAGYGVLRYAGGLAGGADNIFVTYTAGYVTVPDELISVCVQAVDYLMKNRLEDHSMQSESLGDYSYSSAKLEEGLTEEAMNQLKRFRRLML